MDNNTNKPRIIFSTYDDIHNPYYGGGGAIAVHKTAKNLTDTFDVVVLSWDYSGIKKEVIDGVRYERFGRSFIPSKIGMIFYQLFLPYQMKKRSFDLFIESFCPPFTTAFLPLYTNKKVVGVVHMLAGEDMERKYKLPFRYIEQFGLKKYTNIIVTSDQLKETVLKTHPKAKLTVISNGIDKVYDTMIASKKYVLFLGRIEIDQKGLDILITAFKQFNLKHYNEYKLYIAGNGDKLEMDRLTKLIKSNAIAEQIKFLGKVTGEEKVELFRRASCVVVPSRFETYSIVALEALAHRTPLVCFAIAGLSWVPSHIAYKVNPLDSNAFASAMESAIIDPQLQIKLDRGCEFAKNYTWKKIFHQYEMYIRNLLQM